MFSRLLPTTSRSFRRSPTRAKSRPPWFFCLLASRPAPADGPTSHKNSDADRSNPSSPPTTPMRRTLPPRSPRASPPSSRPRPRSPPASTTRRAASPAPETAPAAAPALTSMPRWMAPTGRRPATLVTASAPLSITALSSTGLAPRVQRRTSVSSSGCLPASRLSWSESCPSASACSSVSARRSCLVSSGLAFPDPSKAMQEDTAMAFRRETE